MKFRNDAGSISSSIKKLSADLRSNHQIPRWVRRLLKAPSWAVASRREENIKEAARFARSKLLDVGCGWKPYREYFPYVSTYVGTELPSTRSKSKVVDVYVNGFHLPFCDHAFDTVLCTQVLEHVPSPEGMLGEISRVLQPAGHLILTAPHMSFLHEEPDDYYRFTKYGLRYLLESNDFEIIYILPEGGYWLSGGTMFSYYLWSGGYIRKVIAWPLVLLVQAMSSILDRIECVEIATCNYIAVGKKLGYEEP